MRWWGFLRDCTARGRIQGRDGGPIVVGGEFVVMAHVHGHDRKVWRVADGRSTRNRLIFSKGSSLLVLLLKRGTPLLWYTTTTTLHYSTLHYTTRHYTTLHYTTLHDTTLHYTTLHDTTLHYTTLHYTTLRNLTTRLIERLAQSHKST